MNTPADDDARLESLLKAPLETLADDGFSAAVMRRVRAEAVASRPATIDGSTALEHLRQRDARERRWRRGQIRGAGIGTALAAAVWWLGGGPVVLPTSDALAPLLGLAAMAWLLAAEAMRGPT